MKIKSPSNSDQGNFVLHFPKYYQLANASLILWTEEFKRLSSNHDL